jgi:hypothetical protein
MHTATAAEAAATDHRRSEAEALSRACTALWVATLSLMTAFMQTSAPAHRHLIARKIAKNLGMLCQETCFTAECRMIFSNLSQRWNAKAEQLARHDSRDERPRGGIGMLQPAMLKAH